MKQFLVDSGALLAMIDAGDENYAAAAAFAHGNTNAIFYLPDTVFVETMVLTKARLGAKPAVELGNQIMESSQFLVVYLDTEGRRVTWDIFSRYTDKDWSYVDCSILALARRQTRLDPSPSPSPTRGGEPFSPL